MPRYWKTKDKMLLSELKSFVPGATVTGDAEIGGIVYDSREVKPGDLFVALVGASVDGHEFVRGAVDSGAVAAMVDRAIGGIVVPQLLVDDTRLSLGKVSAGFFDFPSQRMRVIGVTGTNGKTTTTHIIRSVLEVAGLATGMIGTIAYSVGGEELPASNTTPESLTVQRLLAQMVDAGAGYAVMEVSSHALDQGRVDDVEFAAAVFMNLSPEHLDFHKDMPSYARAKGKLFEKLPSGAVAVVNSDDDYVEDIVFGTAADVIRFGFASSADVRITDFETGLEGSRCTVESPWGKLALTTAMPGKHNVYNCVAAATVTAAMGIDTESVVRGIAALKCVRGRLEPVDEGQDFAVYVDYAHSDDALENVLNSVRKLTNERVIAVFGCGGDRDASKRPRMRAIAEELADHCVVTSDNPRSEDPQDIIDQIMRGVRDMSKFTVEVDRAAAIRCGIEMAEVGDVVLIAGKGHETYQILGDRRIHFDDCEVARGVLREVAKR